MNPATGWKYQRAVLCLVALTLVLGTWERSGGLRAQSPVTDPVERLRRTLKSTAGDVPAREQSIRQCLGTLHGVGELRQAVMLAEWRDRSPDPEVAAVDRTLRKIVADRFIKATREMLESKDQDDISLALGLLVDMATTARESPDSPSLVHYFTSDIVNLAKNGEPRMRLAAARALGTIDPNVYTVVPVLENLLAAPDATLRRGAADGLSNVVQASFQTTPSGVAPRDAAARRETIQTATTILSALHAGYGDSQPEVRRRCVGATQRIAAYAHQLSSEPTKREGMDEREMQLARTQLETERTELRPLLLGLRDQTPYLARALKDEDTEVQLAALQELETLANLRWRWVRQGQWLVAPVKTGNMPLVEDPLGESLQAALPALAAALTANELRVRRSTLDVLNVLGPVAAPAAPAVARMLADSDRFVRWTAVRTLNAIGSPGALPAIPVLAKLLEDPDEDVAKAAIDAVVHLDPTGQGVPPRGKNASKNPGPRNAVPALIHVMSGHDADIRILAMQALRGMGENARPAVVTLSAALGDTDARVRRTAAEILGELGPVAREAGPDLSLAAKDPDANVRKAASDALLRIGRAN